VDGSRSALIVASDNYTDPGLRRLRAPASDAQALAGVLRDPGIGGFEVHTLLNEPAHEVNLAVEEFFADRRPDDLLLLHVSCHGVKDEGGELYFATSNTLLRRLGATAVAAEFVNRRMSRSRSRRVVLLLDCCYAGAFERGMTARAGTGMAIEEQFGGRGRAVITASSAMEYAFEGDELADTQELQPSVFTSALVEGLETGEADRDQDGMVALDELYDYVYDKVRAVTPNQTPGKWTFGVQGDLFIARRARPVTTPSPLPPELQEAIDSSFAAVRAGAVQELARLLESRHAGVALAARLALERLSEDDSRAVCAAATAALGIQTQPAAPKQLPPEPVPPQPASPKPVTPRLELSATVVDFGQLPQHSKSPERRVRLGNAGSGTLNARAATQASWLKLRQVSDELVVAVDTTTVGEHDGVVTVDSDGGSATIRVQARVDPAPLPAPLPAPEPDPTTRPDAVLEPERARPGRQEQAALPKASRAPVPAAPQVAAPTPTSPTAAVDHGAASEAPDDRRLLVAGGLAMAGAVLTVVGLFPVYRGTFRLTYLPAITWSTFIIAALALSAGICIFAPRTRRLIGPGLLLGAVATSPTAVWFGIILPEQSYGTPGPGLWLVLLGGGILVLGACLAGLALARMGEVRIMPRPLEGALPWLVVLLGVAGAVAFISQVPGQAFVPGRGQAFVPKEDLVPTLWTTAMALAVPACAAVAVPRQFGVALLAGWIGCGAASVAFTTEVVSGSVFGYTLLALLVVMVPFARTAPASQVERTSRD
jgi:hypothetical protein